MKMKRTSVAAVLTAALLVTGVTTVFATSKAPEPLKIDNLPQAVQGDPLPDPAPAPEKDDPAPDTSIPSSQPTPTQAPEPVAEPVELAAKPAEGTPQPQEPVQMEPTSSTLENRWGVPDGEIPQWTELTAASFEDAHALGQYLETVHGLYPGDYTTGRSNGIVTVQITYSERAIRERLPDGVYPVNSKGETYGRAIDSEVVGYDPDLILVQATNGESGYAFNRDLSYGGYPGEINNPDDAMAYMEWRKTQPNTILIPVYDVDRNNIIGYFGLSNSSDMTPGEELEIVKAHMRQSMDMAE